MRSRRSDLREAQSFVSGRKNIPGPLVNKGENTLISKGENIFSLPLFFGSFGTTCRCSHFMVTEWPGEYLL